MRFPRNHIAVVITSVAMLLATGAPAMAAPAPKTVLPAVSTAASTTSSITTATPVKASAGGPLDVQVWPGQEGQTIVITVVEVDADIKLPVTVRIPVVPGTTVQWAGEITGGDAASDLQQPFALVMGQGGQFAEFQLTKSRRGQIDTIGFPLKVEGDTRSVSLDWVQSVSSALTAISVRLPANTSKAQISPEPAGRPVTNPEGESLFTLDPKGYKPGDTQAIAISYSTIPEVAPTPGSELTPILIGLGLALVVVVGALVYVIRRQGAATVESDDLDLP